jgi:hypothetical protein
MHRLVLRLRPAIAMLVAASALFTMRPAGAGASVSATWTIQRSPNRSSDFNELTGIATISASDVWGVGTFRGPGSPAFKTLIEHFDGTSWRAVQSPNVGTSDNELNAVTATSSSDVWTVGFEFNGAAERTLIQHWNGTQWSTVSSPNVGSGSNDLRGAAAISSSDAWAVGEIFGLVPSTLAEHWNGTAWSIVPSPTPVGGAFFTSVVAVTSNDVWALGGTGDDGDATLAEHWDGTAWSIVSTPQILSESFFSSGVAISTSDVWAVGSQGSRTLTEHWDGTAWSIVPSPDPLPTSKGNNFLTGVTALGNSDVWAVGATLDFTLGELERTVIEHWDGVAWSVSASPNQGPGSNLLQGVDNPGGVVFAAGTFRQGFAGVNRTLVMETTQG